MILELQSDLQDSLVAVGQFGELYGTARRFGQLYRTVGQFGQLQINSRSSTKLQDGLEAVWNCKTIRTAV
jgi:hypothetical protein